MSAIDYEEMAAIYRERQEHLRATAPEWERKMGIIFTNAQAPDRHVKRFSVSADMIPEIFRGLDGNTLLRCTTHFPDDARVVGIISNEVFNEITFVIESAEFPAVEAQCLPPIEHIEIAKYTPAPGMRLGQVREDDRLNVGFHDEAQGGVANSDEG